MAYIITNRKTSEAKADELQDVKTFNPEANMPDGEVYFCETVDATSVDLGKLNSKSVAYGGIIRECGSEKFFASMRAADVQNVLFYIHGYSNTPIDVIIRSQKLQKKIDTESTKQGHGKTLVVPVIWPTDNDFGAVKDYWDDQKSADASGASFGRAILKMFQWQQKQDDLCDIRMSVIAHSMGNRVLRESLCYVEKELGDMPLMFRSITMAAADVVNETLHRGNRGSVISRAAKKVLVLFASDDLALRGSKVVNLKNRIASRRLGHTGVENLSKAPDNIQQMDCDSFNTAADKPTGHTYFLSGLVIDRLVGLINKKSIV